MRHQKRSVHACFDIALSENLHLQEHSAFRTKQRCLHAPAKHRYDLLSSEGIATFRLNSRAQATKTEAGSS